MGFLNSETLATKSFIKFWVLAFLVLAISEQVNFSIDKFSYFVFTNTVIASFLPLLICSILVATFHKTQSNGQYFNGSIVYLLFFSISITSLLGLTKPLNGSFVESKNLLLYGLPFYTTTIAYAIKNKNLSANLIFISANPLTLITGPIATIFRPQTHRCFSARYRYYFPHVILGLFLYQAISIPLIETFTLIKKTDAASSITFAFIFELFIYTNFCGLSLVVYGVMGIIGVRIPLNFRQPFSSTNLVEYWRAWHISLSTVLKKLFYEPIRPGFGTNAAIFVVFSCSAMWHGVTLNFILWGIFHSTCFVATLFLLRRRIWLLPSVLMIFSILIGRLIFSDSEVERLLEKLLFKFKGFGVISDLNGLPETTKLSLILATSFVATEFLLRKNRWFRQRNYKLYRTPVMQLILIVITMVIVSSASWVGYAAYGQR